MKFRKKPVVIEAFQMTAERREDRTNWPEWAKEAYLKGAVVGGIWWTDFDTMMVGALGGVVRVEVNDWIIQGTEGELYPCKPDIFQQTYDEAWDGAGGGGGGS